MSLIKNAPDELEGVHTHSFKLKPFKKAKSCDICKQAITKEGLICKGEWARRAQTGRFEKADGCPGEIPTTAIRIL
uniref:Uncharacterized protein n=1 Tax=Knipowitschia caucasica TaxID=637954 RepID=A0AAV2L6M0_KNICA